MSLPSPPSVSSCQHFAEPLYPPLSPFAADIICRLRRNLNGGGQWTGFVSTLLVHIWAAVISFYVTVHCTIHTTQYTH